MIWVAQKLYNIISVWSHGNCRFKMFNNFFYHICHVYCRCYLFKTIYNSIQVLVIVSLIPALIIFIFMLCVGEVMGSILCPKMGNALGYNRTVMTFAWMSCKQIVGCLQLLESRANLDLLDVLTLFFNGISISLN